MRFTEIDLFGVYVAPISLMMVAPGSSRSHCAGSPAAPACCDTSGIRPCSCSPSTSSFSRPGS